METTKTPADGVSRRVTALHEAIRKQMMPPAYRMRAEIRKSDPAMYAFLSDLFRDQPRTAKPWHRYPEMVVAASDFDVPAHVVLAPAFTVVDAYYTARANSGKGPQFEEMCMREFEANKAEDIAVWNFAHRHTDEAKAVLRQALLTQIDESYCKLAALECAK